MIRNRNFYDLNGSRSYPLDDRATRTGDQGERLPNDVLVDASLRFPSHLGGYAYLSSLTVTKTLVTATFLACPDIDSPPATFVPLAAVTARLPLQPGRHVALDALQPGVGGWVVFGDVDEPVSVRLSTPRQGLLLPRAARPYQTLPVESVGKVGLAAALTGVVRLRGGTDVEVVADDRFVEGRNRKVVVVRLNSFSSRRNVFDVYKGPCGSRPESGNCDKPGVEFLNTVGPDCDGNVAIVFSGETEVTPYAGGSEGIVLDHPLGLTEACTKTDRLPDGQGRLPNEYDDFCTSEFEGYAYVDEDVAGEEAPVFNVPNVSSEVMGCPELPFTEQFSDLDAEDFRVLLGAFGFADADHPADPIPGVTYMKGYAVYRWDPFVPPAAACGCAAYPDGVPELWTFTVTGATDEMAVLNGDWTATYQYGCRWVGTKAGADGWTVDVILDSIVPDLLVLSFLHSSGNVTYSASGFTDVCGPIMFELEEQAGPLGTPPDAMTIFPAGGCGPCHPSISLSSSLASHSSSSLASSESTPAPVGSYEAQSAGVRNVSIWDTCAHADTMNKKVQADVQMRAGPKMNAGVVLNYHTVGTTSQRDEYMVAEIDGPTDSLRLRFWGGTSFITLGSVAGLGLQADDWYTLDVEITPGADPLTQTLVQVTLTGLTNPAVSASFTASTTRYLPADGRFGVATDGAVSRFGRFSLEDL